MPLQTFRRIVIPLTSGELYYSNGDVFSGEWMNDRASGHGVLKYANGCIYDGNWLEDKVLWGEGQGMARFGAFACTECCCFCCLMTSLFSF